MFQWFVYGVDVVYDVRDVAISGVFAFNELELSSSSVRRVLCEFAIGPGCVADSPNDVWFVMGGSILCWENVFRNDVGGLCMNMCVLLKALLFWLCNWWECGGGSVFCRGCVVAEVRVRLFS